MSSADLESLGALLRERRRGRGVREVAREIGISHATLSRVERGLTPDLETFARICKWLEVDPGEVLGFKASAETPSQPTVSVHFRKKETLSPKTAQALAEMILLAQAAFLKAQQGER